MTRELTSNSVEETERLGERLGSMLLPGDFVGLSGDLGAGKTAFSRGVARGAGIPKEALVSSPTFTIVNAYHGGRLPVFHADLYRVDDAEELYDAGFYDLMESGRAMLVEWIDRVPEVARPVPLWEDRNKVSAEAAARGYLEANCAHCHQPGATASNSGLDLRWEQTDPHALGVMKRPVAAGRGAGELLFDVVPGKPHQSILAYRMASTDGGVAMPELGKSTIDKDGLAVVERWIAGL